MKDSKKILYIVVSIITLIITITGSTYAYFALSTSNNNAITGTTADVGLTLTVTKLKPNTNTTDYLVPQLESALGTAINNTNNCKDANTNTVCQVYKATLTNTGTANAKLKGTISFSNVNNLPNLKWKLITDATTLGSNPTNNATSSSSTFVAEANLNPNQSIDYYFVVWINETGSEQSDNGSYTGSITFTSANGTGITSTIGAAYSGTKYTVNVPDDWDNWTTSNLKLVWIGSTIPSGVTQYDTPALAMSAFSNKPFYLKHTIANDIVTESYVEFVVTPEMASANSGMTAGTYTLRGDNMYEYDANQDDWVCKSEYVDSNTGDCMTSAYYTSNVNVLKQAFGENSGYCTGFTSSSYVNCDVSGLSTGADSFGSVGAHDDSANCYVESDGGSYCGKEG